MSGVLTFLPQAMVGVAVAVFLPLAIAGRATRAFLRIQFLTSLFKCLVAVPLVIPLYVAVIGGYDGREFFNEAVSLEGKDVGVGRFFFGRGSSTNMVTLIALTRSWFGSSFLELHLFSTAAGLAGSFLFALGVSKSLKNVPPSVPAILFVVFPSIFLFSMLLLKDAFTFLSLGLIFWGQVEVYESKRGSHWLQGWIWTALGGVGLGMFRPYALFFAGFSVVVAFLVSVRKVHPLKLVLPFAGILLVLTQVPGLLRKSLVGYLVGPDRGQSISDAMGRLSTVQSAMNSGGSALDLWTIQSVADLPLAPLNILMLVTRPWPWEVTNAVTLMACLETIATLLIFGILILRRKVLARALNEGGVLVLSLVFVLTFLVSFSFIAGNAGTVFRQKMMILPGLLHLLLAALYWTPKKEPCVV